MVLISITFLQLYPSILQGPSNATGTGRVEIFYKDNGEQSVMIGGI